MTTTKTKSNDKNSSDDTRARILNAASELIAQQGPQNFRVRELAAAADTNVASISYYFGSKKELVEEVLINIFTPINNQRMKLLKEFEADCFPEPVSVEKIAEALIRPLVESKRAQDGGSLYIRALQHVRAAPAEAPNIFVFSTFDNVAQYFIDSMQKALPHITRAEMIWRYELVRGAAVHMLSNCDPISGKFRHLAKSDEMIDIDDAEAVLKELCVFSVAGLSAAPSWSEKELVKRPKS